MPTETVQSISMRPILLDDGWYHLKPWLSHHISFQLICLSSEKKFNKLLSSNHVNVEQEFGILKARWQCLLKRLDYEIENVSSVLITCAVLGNICHITEDDYVDHCNTLQTIVLQEQRTRAQRQENGIVRRNGAEVRNALKQFIDNIN